MQKINNSFVNRPLQGVLDADRDLATPMLSSVFEVNFTRAVAARSTCIKYSLSPLDSPSFGLPGLAGLSNEVTSKSSLWLRLALPGQQWRAVIISGVVATCERKIPNERLAITVSCAAAPDRVAVSFFDLWIKAA